MSELWIKEAIPEEREGKYRASVRRRYGKAGFVGGDPKAKIKSSVIAKDSKRKDRIGKQARLAKTLRGLPKT